MDSPISKDLCRSPFLREVLPQRISGGAQFDERRAEAEGKQCGPYDTVQPRRTLCRHVSDDGIAAARSYVSILDTMIVKRFLLMS